MPTSSRKRKSVVPFSARQALQASILVSLILNLVLILGVFFGRSRDVMGELQLGWSSYLYYFLWHFGCNVLMFFLLFLLNFRVVKMKRKRGGLVIVGGTLLICLVLSPVLSQLQWLALGGGDKSEICREAFIVINVIKDLIVGAAVVIITSYLSIYHKREQMMIANQKLQEENIRIKYEALKNQLDPHFLFNSLNTLNGLIGVDDDRAHEYVDNLSSVFRYTLHSKTIVKLEEEIEYVDAYVSMLKIRFGESLHVDYNLDNKYRAYYIMPASLQLLVENAVKHNVVSNKNPLIVRVESTQDDTIIVSNRINPKTEKSIGGVGLANLTERYSILFGKSVGISDAEGVFRVEVPLINEKDKKLNI